MRAALLLQAPQAPQESLDKRKAAPEALNTPQLTVNTAWQSQQSVKVSEHLSKLAKLTLLLQAPQESLKKRKAASEALNTAQLTVNNAYLPISLSPNGMSAVLYASFLYQLPTLIGLVWEKTGQALARQLMLGKFSNLIYGATVFVCGLVQLGQDTPKSMAKYLAHVSCQATLSGKQFY